MLFRSGQNLIEAAACGCPLLMGPHTFNFAQAAAGAQAAGAARTLADLPQAVVQAVHIAQAGGAPEMAARALEFAARHRGAARRMAREVLLQLPA